MAGGNYNPMFVSRRRSGRVRFGVNLDLVIDQVDDPIAHNSRPGVAAEFDAAIAVERGIGNLDNQSDLRRCGMSGSIVIDRPPGDQTIRFGFPIPERHWLLRTIAPAFWKHRFKGPSNAAVRIRARRILRHLADQPTFQKLYPVVGGQYPAIDHLVILINRESIDCQFTVGEPGRSGQWRTR